MVDDPTGTAKSGELSAPVLDEFIGDYALTQRLSVVDLQMADNPLGKIDRFLDSRLHPSC